MEKEKVYDNFIMVSLNEGINEKYNFNFDIYNDDEFEIEFLKFIYTYNYLFFNITKQAIYTVINSYPCFWDERQLEFFLKLINGAEIRNKDYYAEIIIEFLLTYFNSLKSYSRQNDIPKKEVDEYIKIFREKIPQTDKYIKKVVDFYKKIIQYSTNCGLKMNTINEARILFNIKSVVKKNDDALELLDNIINEKISLSLFIDYDSYKERHKDIYKEFCIDTDLNSFSFDAAIKIFNVLVKSKLCEDEFVKKFINRIIEKTNNVISNFKNDDHLQAISDIENLIKNLNIIKNIEKLDKNYKEKIKECILKILYVKRVYIKNKDYTENFIKQKYEFEIPQKESDKIKKDVEEDFGKLYNYTRIDFSKQVEDAIKSYSEHALLYHVTTINISDNGVYKIESNYKCDNKYKDFFDKEGKEYVQKNYKRLQNILNKDYYEIMLNDLKTKYTMKIDLLRIILKDHIMMLKEKISEARINKQIQINNLYEEMMTQIVGIEANVFKLAQNNNIKTNNIKNMLENLFDLYKNNDLYRNGIMYIYYTLYCSKGFNLRNQIAHGELLRNSNYDKELLIIYSCLIIINYIVGVEVNEEKKNK